MKWILVALVMNSPVKTDLVFNSLQECMDAEAQMRKEWVQLYNQGKKNNVEAERLGQISKAMTTGTCIPSK
ncbi:hypothetical protein [Chitinilyticum litopenaei]|uniref:hypothetical protein n=1 Tax=Chitinilyticum litopenaei TaxID=1121276 RepID=UPI0004256F17|nr:hypothetical protein [Chitinilyticum litopenaei]